MSPFERNTFARDLARYTALSDQRRAENAASRARARADKELGAVLREAAQRRGQREIDWAEYFRNVGIS